MKSILGIGHKAALGLIPLWEFCHILAEFLIFSNFKDILLLLANDRIYKTFSYKRRGSNVSQYI